MPAQKSFKSSKGFTLIELLITITIVAILATIAIVAFSTTQQSARDAKRKSELATIADAIEASKTGRGNGTYLYTTTDFFNDFSRASGAVPASDPGGFAYCIYTSTSTGLANTNNVNTATGWTGAACPTAPVAYRTISNSFSAETPTPTGGDIANGDIKSWIICTLLERPAVTANNAGASPSLFYCINSGQ